MCYVRLVFVVVVASVMGAVFVDDVLGEDYGAQYGGMDELAGQLSIPGHPERLNQIRFPGHTATRESRTVRERGQLYGGLSLGTPKRVGRLGIRPGLTLSGRYTDNVFQAPKSSDSDWQAIARPAVIVDIPGFLGTDVGRKNRLAVGAHAFLLKSLEHSSEMSTQQWGLFMDGGFNVVDFDTGGSPWKLVVTDAFDQGAVPPTSDHDDWRHYYGNTFSTLAGYHLADRWHVEAGYSYLWREYRKTEAERDDFSEHGVTGRLHYKIAPKTTVFVGGAISWAERQRISAKDSENYTGEVGIQWNATEKLNGEIAATYQEKQMNKSSYRKPPTMQFVNGQLIDDIGDENIFGYRANVTWNPIGKWTFVLGGERSIQETWLVDGDDLSGPHYEMTNASFTAEWKFQPKWSVSGQVGYTFSDYDTPDRTADSLDAAGNPTGVHRKDEFITAAMGVRCQVHDRVTVSLEVRHDVNESKVDGFDYDRNTVTLTAMCAF